MKKSALRFMRNNIDIILGIKEAVMFKWPWEKEKEEPGEKPSWPLEAEEDFSKSRINGITFAADRLPYLKILLTRYEEDESVRVEQRRRYSKIRDIFQNLTREFTSHFGNEVRDMMLKKELLHYPNQELLSRILVAYAGTLFKELGDLRENGWDGENCYTVDTSQDSYRSDVRFRLRALVEGLEAGNSEVTLNIPSEYSSRYEYWFTNAISWAINTGKGPTAIKK